MRERMLGAARVLAVLSQAALWIAAIGMVVMTAMVAWQVFARYVLNASPSWTEPASIMVMSWFIFLGAAVGVRENFHMGFDVLIHFLPGAGPWMRAVSDLAVAVFGLGMWGALEANKAHGERMDEWRNSDPEGYAKEMAIRKERNRKAVIEEQERNKQQRALAYELSLSRGQGD